MKWLVVVGENSPQAKVKELLRAAAAKVADGAEWIPLAPDDVTIEVEGPNDLPTKLAGEPEIKDIYPSSDMSYY